MNKITVKTRLTLELPSGVTIQQKITANLKSFSEELDRRVFLGEDMEQIRDELQERCKQNIKNLADKMYLMV